MDDSIRLLALSPNVDPSVPMRLLEMGVDGVITKSSTPEEFVEAVREVHRGRRHLDSRVARNIVLDRVSGRLSPLDALTPREIEVMTWLAKGSRGAGDCHCPGAKSEDDQHAPKPGLPQARCPFGRGARAARESGTVSSSLDFVC